MIVEAITYGKLDKIESFRNWRRLRSNTVIVPQVAEHILLKALLQLVLVNHNL